MNELIGKVLKLKTPIKAAVTAGLLALLAVGYYFNAALGFNGLTLRVYGLVRYVVVVTLAAAVANTAIALVLIPPYGALGAAIGTCATLVAHNVLKQAGLRRGTGIGILDREHLRVYGTIVLTTAVLLGLHALLHPGLIATVALVGGGSAAVLWITRGVLDVGDTFPELQRLLRRRRSA
jgi:O-antigen/teichoic acid export membrane protein